MVRRRIQQPFHTSKRIASPHQQMNVLDNSRKLRRNATCKIRDLLQIVSTARSDSNLLQGRLAERHTDKVVIIACLVVVCCVISDVIICDFIFIISPFKIAATIYPPHRHHLSVNGMRNYPQARCLPGTPGSEPSKVFLFHLINQPRNNSKSWNFPTSLTLAVSTPPCKIVEDVQKGDNFVTQAACLLNDTTDEAVCAVLWIRSLLTCCWILRVFF